MHIFDVLGPARDVEEPDRAGTEEKTETGLAVELRNGPRTDRDTFESHLAGLLHHWWPRNRTDEKTAECPETEKEKHSQTPAIMRGKPRDSLRNSVIRTHSDPPSLACSRTPILPSLIGAGASQTPDPLTSFLKFWTEKVSMSLDPDLAADALPTALFIARHLAPFKNDLLYFQDAFTGTRPFPTIVLFVLLNGLFYFIQKLNLSLYSLLSILVLLATVHIDYYIFLFHVFCYWFRRPPDFVARPWFDATLPIDVLSARCGVLYCCIRQLSRVIGNSLALFSFVNVGFITVILSACFYGAYLVGDRTVTWLLVNALFLIPIVITRKLGFASLLYPEALEAHVLAHLQQQLEARAGDAAPPALPQHPEEEEEEETNP
jgi:hypothetical protein